MKYPRYTREQNLACKLTDEDISLIRKSYKRGVWGHGQGALAKKFNVTKKAIRYWISEEHRKKYLEQAEKWLKDNGRIDGDRHIRDRRRKKIVMPDKIREYNRIKQLRFNKNHPGYGNRYYTPHGNHQHYQRHAEGKKETSRDRYYRLYHSDPLFRKNELERARKKYESRKNLCPMNA